MVNPVAPAQRRTRLAWPPQMTWVVGLGTAIGYSNTAAQSWLDAALIKHKGLSIEAAGWTVAAESLAMAIAMIVFAPFIARAHRKTLFIYALTAVVAVQLLSCLAQGFWALTASRAAAGILFGLLYTIAISNGAASSTPQRTFAGGAAIALAVGTLFNPLMGFGADFLGYAGIQLGLALYVILFALPLLPLKFGTRLIPSESSDEGGRATINISAALAVLGVMGLLTVATNGTLLFMVQIGQGLGLSGAEIGTGLALVSLLSALGGVAASRLGTRLGMALPIGGGLVAMGLFVMLLTNAATQPVFWMSVTAIVALFWFLNSYILGLSVEVDPGGRLAPITASVKIMFSAVAATVASGVAGRFGISAVGIMGLATCSVAVLISLMLIRHIGRGANSKGVASPMR